MARIAWPSTLTAAVPRPLGWMRVLMPVLLVAGCAPWDRPLPIPKEVTQAGAAARVVVPRDLNVNPSESVVEPGTPAAEPAPSQGPGPERTIFALPDAIAFALRNSPRLRSARAAIERARGQEQVAFAPFLPHIDVLAQYGVVSATLAPGVPGNEGFLLANGSGTRSYAQTEVGLQWTLYDFGRTGGRYRQAVARERITELELARADQTVEFDVAAAYLDALPARASRPAPGSRPGAANGGGRRGGSASRPGRVSPADLRPGRRGTYRRGKRDYRLAGGSGPARGGTALRRRPAPRRTAVGRGGHRGRRR